MAQITSEQLIENGAKGDTVSNENCTAKMRRVFKFLPIRFFAPLRLCGTIFFLLQWTTNSAAQVSAQALHVLEENSAVILEAGKLFNISPRLIASVIYVEHALNVTWIDRDVDPLLAGYGLNVSLGLGQVKINTALWIEKSLSDSTSLYFLGRKFSKIIPLSTSREELVHRLLAPELKMAPQATWNTKYIAANLAMVRHRWKEAGINIDNRTDILATLYSAGVVTDDAPMKSARGGFAFGGEKRPPHKNPQANSFGKLAKEFYESELLLSLFPN